MQTPEPTLEHQYLLQLVGDWNIESECVMGPDQPPLKSTATQSTRAVGSLWILGEMDSLAPDETPVRSLMTLGFDPARGKFVGTFVASCMTNLWLYEGSIDAQRRILTLETDGPSILGDGSMAKYHDIIEFLDPDTYLFTSEYYAGNAQWINFMRGKHTRRKK